ncbi:bifunctional phosphoribosylaminoimidazolecarboxamide formyltransferase/IMP cyclohydrolase [Culicoidibacter larvae]|uniref:Bifunctional purine biosynthesis protein PurH n=1 Tax=Culicoidibacter larvae TaxID=2579976 RepID=A0A5R8QCT8_9FIRM|nr:bifunctional phosphoribosylaminoimidazolecarboxamide formyltransferase/IMP cyclohydrolase [Culicoidibacter larvae]TLG74328.1 bifunctional phosphoribosylaminoimidazolecarboxamide formyltransferase/IMP cyclohydrolase [Culicoidibacter larvae]
MNKKQALISVSDKTGIANLAKQLIDLGYELISTGGTEKMLLDAAIPVKNISVITGFPEILDGRVKTLDPHVHGGLLAVHDDAQHMQQLADNDIDLIDLVVVNLYPFKATISNPDCQYDDAIENIDIGGPSMLRSAAKNHRYVTVLTDPEDYSVVVEELTKNGETSFALRQQLAAKVFRHTAAYDSLIAEYLTKACDITFPEQLTLSYELKQSLRYGENPHQAAAFYAAPIAVKGTISSAIQLHGKELSYNNIQDANAALQIVKEFNEPAVVALKHMNPCGVGIGSTIYEAWQKAYEADKTSIFGGIIAVNGVVDAKTAREMSEIFLEIILAEDFTPDALEILQKKKNIRLLMVQFENHNVSTLKVVSVEGGLLVQEEDRVTISADDLTVVTKTQPTADLLDELLFAWKVVKHVKSNAIVLAKDAMTIGIGAGQMNRIGAARIAIEQAGDKALGSVLASDAFFPMPDTVEAAAAAGVKAIIQPGGSIKDDESIACADKYGIVMVTTGIRHFKH